MTIATWSSNTLSDSDANYRVTCSELSTYLQAMPKLVKTADTGQANWTTAVKTVPVFEVYYLNDALHATAPLYLKITYSSNNVFAAGGIRLSFEVGTGTNGAGTLTGPGSGTTVMGKVDNNGDNGSASNFASYLCVNEGFFGLQWKVGSAVWNWFTLCRTCNADGTPNGGGSMWMARNSNGNNGNAGKCQRYEATAANYGIVYSSNYSHVPMDNTQNMQNGDYQLWPVWGSFPDMRPMFALATGVVGNFPSGTVYTSTVVGATPRTFIATPVTSIANGSGAWNLQMLWE